MLVEYGEQLTEVHDDVGNDNPDNCRASTDDHSRAGSDHKYAEFDDDDIAGGLRRELVYS